MSHRPVILACALLAAFSQGAPAQVQHNLGGGAVLDNNLRDGGGRVNPAQQVTDFTLGNAIVTGNVTGLAGFRDVVNYGAVGEFGGATGADTFFDFNRRSYTSDLNYVTTPGGAYGGLPTGQVYRPLSATTAGQVRAAPPGTLLVQPRDAYVRPRDFRGDYGRDAGGPIGMGVDESGRLLQVNASPLLGVRLQPMDPPMSPPAEGRELAGPAADAPDAARPGYDRATSPESGIDARLNLRLSPRVTTEEPTDAALRDRLDQLSQTLLTDPPAADEGEATGSEAYEGLMNRLRLRTPVTDEPEQGEDGQAPTDEEAAQQRLEETEARLRARGLEGDAPDDEPDQPEVSPNPLLEDRQMEEPARPGSVEDLIQSLRRESQPIETLTTRGGTDFDRKLKEAERAMAQGDYLDAEQAYAAALGAREQAPLARLGRVNAQLGAGMLSSAAANLWEALEANPELLSVQLEGALLPTAGRLEWVSERLDGMIGAARGPQIGLALAYVGRQTGRPQLVRQGLEAARRQAPDEPLVDLAQKVWLSDPAPAAR